MDPTHSAPLLGKLSHLRDTLDEIERWESSGRPETSGADVATLLHSVLARRSVSLDTIPLYLEEERSPGLA
jgi:hypothetical protein